MKQKNVLIGIVVIVIVAIGIWYFMSQKQPTDVAVTPISEQPAGGNTATTPVTSVKKTGTLRSTFTQGGNYTCTLTTIDDSNGKTTGTVYSANGKTRTEFRIQSSTGVVTELHIIRDGTTAYTWVSGQVTGTKTAITATSPFVPRQPSGAVISVSDDSSVSTDCHPWLPDVSQFVPPTNITFVKA